MPEGNKSRVSGDGLESNRPATNFPGISVDSNRFVGNLIRFQGISFTIEDDQALKDQARAAAVEDAAQTATLAGVELGELVYITESGGSVSPQSFRGAIAFAEAVTPIQTGELQGRVSLQAAFDIDPTAN